GLLDEAARRTQGIGADIMVQPTGAGVLMGLTSAPMPVRIADRLAQEPGVKVVTPVFAQTFGGLTVVYGIDLAAFESLSGGFRVLQGRTIQGGLEVMVDDIYAQSNKLQVGAKHKLFDNDFEVVGIVDHGKGARLFIPISTMQRLLGNPDKCSLFFVKVTDRRQMDDVLARFKALLPGYIIRSMDEYTSLITSGSLPGLKPFQRIMIGIAVVIGFLVIFLAMYTTVLER